MSEIFWYLYLVCILGLVVFIFGYDFDVIDKLEFLEIQ